MQVILRLLLLAGGQVPLGNKDEFTLSTLVIWPTLILKKEGSIPMTQRTVHRECLKPKVHE